MTDELRFEDYKKEHSKYILEQKHQYSGNVIGIAFRNQNVDAVMDAHAAVLDYIMSIPLEETDTKGQGIIDELLVRLDHISDTIWGNPNDDRVKALRNRFSLTSREVKVSSVRLMNELSNFQYLLRELRDIHLKAGYFTTSSGLRLTIHKKRKYGWDQEMEEEGFEGESDD